MYCTQELRLVATELFEHVVLSYDSSIDLVEMRKTDCSGNT